MFTFQNIDLERPEIDGTKADILNANTNTAKFNLWFEIVPASKTFNLEFNTDLFKTNTAKSI